MSSLKRTIKLLTLALSLVLALGATPAFAGLEPVINGKAVICSYSITDRNNDLPHNRIITISALLGPYASTELNHALTEGRWFGDGLPQPPPGYQRVPVGSRGITLTDAAPRATVDFEMLYRPLPATPR